MPKTNAHPINLCFLTSSPNFVLYLSLYSLSIRTGAQWEYGPGLSCCIILIHYMIVVTSPRSHLKHRFIHPAARDPLLPQAGIICSKKIFEEGHRKEGRKPGLARHLLILKEAQNLDRCYGNHYSSGFPLFCSFSPLGSMRSQCPLELSSQAKSKKQEDELEITVIIANIFFTCVLSICLAHV